MYVQPYLFFDGRCEEALSFYRNAIGAETTCRATSACAPEATATASAALAQSSLIHLPEPHMPG